MNLVYEFDGWLGGCIVEGAWTYIATNRVANRLAGQSLTGCVVRDVEVLKSEEFEERHPNVTLPEFVWLDVNGEAGVDDFGSDQSRMLVVSARVFDILRDEGLGPALFESWPRQPGVADPEKLAELKRRLREKHGRCSD
ncbi:hypothetical protein AB0M28_14235 [Streptomyces sp. NPDC051940]|uniref:hypothetical protein n=1 Tax=Streptomyces sp. NPDC051940 TaxID=3155675 RepID=UPI003414B60E